MTRALLAVLLCATAAGADVPTHQVVITTPGGEVVSEPMERAKCEAKAAKIDGHVLLVRLPVGMAAVTLSARCEIAGVSS